ncbi:hypothetical protein L6452_38720 [Arctium lappa]|uniref:Uncharacterized protein n=1 Tax=Arctium lappa TaxID=4217 RepID=A0ACB8XQW2_ARCLA|nr:hypothetical protein L6452_38720 [Arctium lappa]
MITCRNQNAEAAMDEIMIDLVVAALGSEGYYSGGRSLHSSPIEHTSGDLFKCFPFPTPLGYEALRKTPAFDLSRTE